MSKTTSKGRKASNGRRVVQLPTLREGVFITLKGKSARAGVGTVRTIRGASMDEAGKALSRPGLNAKSVFTHARVSSYSIDPRNPATIVRESASGAKTRGRVVGGHFRAVTDKK